MKLTNGDIFKAKEPLQRLIDERLPVLTSYKLAKLASKLNDQLRVIDEVRQGLIRMYGEPGERGQVVVAENSENFPKFVEEFDELMALEIEIVIEKVKLPETLEIEASALMALEKFIDV